MGEQLFRRKLYSSALYPFSVWQRIWRGRERSLAPRDEAALSAFYFFVFAGIGFGLPFIPLFLRDRGYDLASIGALTAMFAAVGGMMQMPLGAIADRFGIRRVPIFAACLLTAISYVLYPFAGSFVAYAVLFAASGVGFFSSATISAALVADLTDNRGSTAGGFGNVRMWGSVGFVAALAAAAAAPGIVQGNCLLYLVAAMFLGSGCSILLSREPRSVTTTVPILSSIASLLGGGMMVFLVSFFLFRVAESATSSFLSLHLQELGGGEPLVAVAYALNAVVEIPVILAIGPISDRLGRRPLILLAFFVLPIRLLAYSRLANPASVLWIQLSHGLTFGIMVVLSLTYIADLAPARLRATGQALLSLSAAAAMAIGPYLAGRLAHTAGLPNMFAALAGVALLGWLLFLIFGRESLGHQHPAGSAEG